MTERVKTLDEIWKGDRLGRRQEAEDLLAYIESVATRPSFREDSHGYTIAVDGGYGEGKTFFLRRLKEHLALNHPVAFIDAWADYIADEPLTALAATLKEALGPLIQKSDGPVSEMWQALTQNWGKIAGIAALGLAKRAAGLVVTAGAVDAIGDVLSDVSEEIREVVSDGVRDIGKEAVDGAERQFNSIAPGKLMEDRIAAFKTGQRAIQNLKDSLAQLVSSLDEQDLRAPIVIIIDELDRCRPTYAIKLLEEIKHLFDVPGVVFILGMNGDQLAHSVSGSYGDNFDGSAYLRRFINRYYRLRTPDLKPLVEHLLQVFGIDQNCLRFPNKHFVQLRRVVPISASEGVSYYMQAYGLHPRDVFHVLDMLQVCVALTNKVPLLMAYLLPLIISRHLGEKNGVLRKPEQKASEWLFALYENRYEDNNSFSMWDMAHAMEDMTAKTDNDLSEVWYRSEGAFFRHWVEVAADGKNSDADFRNYPKLLEKVGQFSNPNLPQPDEALRLSS